MYLQDCLSEFKELSELVFDGWGYPGNKNGRQRPTLLNVNAPQTLKGTWKVCPDLVSIQVGQEIFLRPEDMAET